MDNMRTAKEFLDTDKKGQDYGETMNLEYNPNENRTKELLEYLVEKKLNDAKKIYEECKKWPHGIEKTKDIGLTYINSLYNIKNMYHEEVTGLDEGIRELVLKIMHELKITSVEVNQYIQSNIAM